MASIAVVVVEPGGDWPSFVCETAHDVVVLSQARGEPDGIGDRSMVRLAVLACNADADDESIHRRAFTASRLLTAVAHFDGGQLILSARNGASAALRLGLIGLAATLSSAALASLASVSVRIGDGVVWLGARADDRPSARTDAREPSLEIARRDSGAEWAALASNPDRVSFLPKAWRLDTSGFDRSQEGHNRGRKALPS